MTIHDDLDNILISKEEIQRRVEELGKELSEVYKDEPPLLVCVLKGGSIFLTDLIREMDIYLDIDFMDVSSYGDAFTSSGEVKIIKDIGESAEGRHVVFVEDIIDTGNTLSYLMNMFENRNAKSVKAVTLLDKPSRHMNNLSPDWFGFTIPDEFIVGYGLDYKGKYRNLPYVGVLKPEIYE